MLIYIRHGDDRGEAVYRHDRSLNDRGWKKADKAFGKLSKKYGHPDTLIVSPFRRAVQTAEAMTERGARSMDVRRDPRLAQYLGGKRDPSLHPETAAIVAINESKADFSARVRDHVKEAKRRHEAGAAIWCITHQIVIEEAAEQLGVKIPGDFDFLDHVVMLG